MPLTSINTKDLRFFNTDNQLTKDALVAMIRSLVQSAFQTGCLSVASEGLIRQVLAMKGYQATDLDALVTLYEAMDAGYIAREAREIGMVASYVRL